VKEEQTVEVVATGGLGGTFTLAFGSFIKSLPGTVSVVQNSAVVTTTADLTESIARGDSISLAGVTYVVDLAGTFTATTLTLSTNYAAKSQSGLVAKQMHTTVNLPFNIAAADMQKALLNLPSLGDVSVTRATIATGFRHTVVFNSDIGPQTLLVANTELLVGTAKAVNIAQSVAGVKPNAYKFVTVPSSPAAMVKVVSFLTTGTQYYVEVAAHNDRGYGPLAASTPLNLSPRRSPGAPGNVLLARHTDTSLEVRYDETADSGGEAIDKYKVEWALDPTFGAGNTSSVELPISSKYQKITTSAHTAPLSGTFTVSFGGYLGDFSVLHCGSCATVTNGGSAITVAGATPTSSIARGDYVMVGDQKFRVSTDPSLTYSNTNIPIATLADSTVPATFSGALTGVPMYTVDTSMGIMTIATTSTTVTTVSDLRNVINRGEYVRLGDPVTGETFRVSTNPAHTFDATNLPLSTVGDPMKAASLVGSTLTSRPLFRRQTTSSVSVQATAADMKEHLEALTQIGTVDVTRTVEGNGYLAGYLHTRPRQLATTHCEWVLFVCPQRPWCDCYWAQRSLAYRLGCREDLLC
jgi:hypothetical protein